MPCRTQHFTQALFIPLKASIVLHHYLCYGGDFGVCLLVWWPLVVVLVRAFGQ